MLKSIHKPIVVIIFFITLIVSNLSFAADPPPMNPIVSTSTSVLFQISSGGEFDIGDLWCTDSSNNKLDDCTMANSLQLTNSDNTEGLLLINNMDPNKSYDRYVVITMEGSSSSYAPKKFSLEKDADKSSVNDVTIKKMVKSFEEGKSLKEIVQEIAAPVNNGAVGSQDTSTPTMAPPSSDLATPVLPPQDSSDQSQDSKKGDKFDLLGRLSINKTFLYVDISLLILVLVLEFIHLIKSNRGWGLVFDGKSKKPLQGAVVRIFKEEQNKILETKVTDDLGRFNFLVKQGSYYLEVVKDGFRYPSKLITKKNDEFYSNMYRGEVLKIFRNNASLSLSVPLDPMGQSSEGIEQELKKMSSFWLKAMHFFIHNLRLTLLYLLTLLHIGVILLNYTTPLITAIVLVAIVWLLEIYSILAKGYR